MNYADLCYRVVLPVADRVLGYSVARRFDELLRFQWKSAEDMENYRSRRLTELLKIAERHVPYYREFFQRHGYHAHDLGSVEGLRTLPVIDKTELRQGLEQFCIEGHAGAVIKMQSSGSTGLQTTVLVDKSCNTEVFATQLLYLNWGRFRLGKPHLQTGIWPQRGVVRLLKDTVFRCRYMSVFQLNEEKLARAVEMIRRHNIRCFMGYASSLYLLARYVEGTNQSITLDYAFTWGDSLFPHYRALIERVFGCRVTDCYGLGEGLQCAAQCEQYDALHEHMHGIVLEILDREDKPCAEGELGRVVVTRLDAGPMPLIRYDTGDIASFVEGRCACGRELRRLSRIQGRATDVITTPAGDRLVVHVFTQVFEMVPEIQQFQVRQADPSAIRVLVVPGKGFGEAALEQVRRGIVQHCTVPPDIQFETVDEIPLEQSNKRRFVISSVPF